MMRRLPLILGVICAACTDDPIAPPIRDLAIDVVESVLFPGDSTRLTAVVQDVSGNYLVDPAVTWTTSDSGIIRISGVYAVAVRAGRAAVSLHYGAQHATHELRVEAGFISLESGPSATCGFVHNGELYCWGERRAIGDAALNSTPILLPRRVPTDLRFTQVSVGSNATCGVTSEQRAYCWGTGRRGEDGTGDVYYNSDVPRPVAGDLRFQAVSSGWEHSCGLTPEGVVYCWGRGGEGQLGRGTFDFGHTPAPILSDLRFTQMQAAGSNTCALTHNGEMYCWGQYHYLGDPALRQNQNVPRRIPVPPLVMFDAANDDPCGITRDNQLYCWTSTIEHVAAAGAVKDVTLGGRHVCITRTNNEVLCYGQNNFGQLGTGDTMPQLLPAAIAGAHRFVQVSAGANHTCGMSDTGSAYCWGQNNFGQLGLGTREYQQRPARVLLSRP